MKIDLYNGDCLEIMDKLIADGVTVDLTVTSPPYDNLRTYNDTLVWNENIWKSVLDRLFKITKDGGVVVWIVNDATIKGSETGTSFKQALYAKEIGFNLHDTMIWQKTGNGCLGSNNTYHNIFEYMFIFSKGKPKNINLIKDRENKIFNRKNNVSCHIGKNGKGRNRTITTNKLGKRNNIWIINQQQKIKHPAPFPRQLAKDHIISWSNENDLILDCFMGSGTVGVACKELNRNFIGIELVEDYFKLAEERINKPKDTLF